VKNIRTNAPKHNFWLQRTFTLAENCCKDFLFMDFRLKNLFWTQSEQLYIQLLGKTQSTYRKWTI